MTCIQGLREGGSGGTSYPDPGLGGPEELRSSRSARSVLDQNFSSLLIMRSWLWAKNEAKFERRPFFCSSPNFGQKLGPNLSEDLFLIYFFVLHLILGARHRSSYHLENFLSEALLVSSLTSPFFFISSLTCISHVGFGRPFPLTALHIKFKSLYYTATFPTVFLNAKCNDFLL